MLKPEDMPPLPTPSSPVARALYRSLLQVAREYRIAGLPLSGIYRTAVGNLPRDFQDNVYHPLRKAVVEGNGAGPHRLRSLFAAEWIPAGQAGNVLDGKRGPIVAHPSSSSALRGETLIYVAHLRGRTWRPRSPCVSTCVVSGVVCVPARGHC